MHHVDLLVLSAPVALFVLTGLNGDHDGGSVPLNCEGHAVHLAPPATADGEDGFLIALA